MNTYLGSALAFAAVVALSACSGGSSGGSSSGGSAGFPELAARGNALLAKHENSVATPVSAMPTSGSATYNGVAAYSQYPDAEYIVENAEIVSEVRLNANFASGAVNGQLHNFRSYDRTPISGTVAITNGMISGNQLEAGLSGNLAMGGTQHDVDGALAGVFLNRDHGAIAGGLGANVGGEAYYGVFGAER